VGRSRSATSSSLRAARWTLEKRRWDHGALAASPSRGNHGFPGRRLQRTLVEACIESRRLTLIASDAGPMSCRSLSSKSLGHPTDRRDSLRLDQAVSRVSPTLMRVTALWSLASLSSGPAGSQAQASLALLRGLELKTAILRLLHVVRNKGPGKLWESDLQRNEVEQAFTGFKGESALRSVRYQIERWIQSHIFTLFLACCLQVNTQRAAGEVCGGPAAARDAGKGCVHPSANDKRVGNRREPLCPA
jgi:hypothetical protein